MNDLPELLDHYFSLGVAEGNEGRDHDTNDGDAQATRDLIDQKIQRLQREVEEARAVIAWANNSLFGSHGFFLSLNGGEPDEHHLDRAIEALKEGNRKARQQGIEDALGTLTAHELYQYRPKAFEGFIAYARTTLMGEAKAEETRT